MRIPELLGAARRFLDGDRSTAPDAAFCAALLTREALEAAFVAWAHAALAIDVRGVRGRAQLAVIEEHVRPRAIARRARFAWHELSALLHHGPLHADPVSVRRLLAEAAAVVRGLAADAAARRVARPRHNASASERGAT